MPATIRKFAEFSWGKTKIWITVSPRGKHSLEFYSCPWIHSITALIIAYSAVGYRISFRTSIQNWLEAVSRRWTSCPLGQLGVKELSLYRSLKNVSLTSHTIVTYGTRMYRAHLNDLKPFNRIILDESRLNDTSERRTSDFVSLMLRKQLNWILSFHRQTYEA